VSYEIVKSLRIVQLNDGRACAISGQSSNNVSPRDFSPRAGFLAESETALRAHMLLWQITGSWQFPRNAGLVQARGESALTPADAQLLSNAQARWTRPGATPHTLSLADAKESLAHIKDVLAQPADPRNWERSYYDTPESRALLETADKLLAGTPVSDLQAAERKPSVRKGLLETNLYELADDHWLRTQRGYTHFQGSPEHRSGPRLGVRLFVAREDEQGNLTVNSDVRTLKSSQSPTRDLTDHRQLSLAQTEGWPQAMLDGAMASKGKELAEAGHALHARRLTKLMPHADIAAARSGEIAGLNLREVAYTKAEPRSWPGEAQAYWHNADKELTQSKKYPFLAQRPRDAHVWFAAPFTAEKLMVTDAQWQNIEAMAAQDERNNCPPISAQMAVLATLLGGKTEGLVSVVEPNPIVVGKDRVLVSLADPEAGTFDVAVVDAKGTEWARRDNLTLAELVPMAMVAVHQSVDRKAQAKEQEKGSPTARDAGR
jgi:hypothetical protein